MALKSIVSVVFALTLLAVCSAQYYHHQINFDSISMNGYVSQPLFPAATANMRGPVVFTVDTLYSVEICITEGIALDGSYTACPVGMGASFPGSSESQTFDSDSLYTDSFDTKIGMSDFLAAPVQPQNLTVYLRNGTFYFVNIHSTATSLNGQNATQAVVTATFNRNNCNNQPKCPRCIGSPENICVSVTNVNSNSSYSFHIDPNNATYYLGMSIPFGAISFSVTLFSSYQQQSGAVVNNYFPTGCIRRGSAPSCAMNISDYTLDGNWTAVNGRANTYSAGFTLNTPTPGNWFFEFLNPVSDNGFNITFTGSVKSCANGLLGVNCTIAPTVFTAPNVTGPVSTGNPYDYYQVTNNTLNIGVGTKNLKINAPSILASTLNWPSNTSALLLDSNKTINFLNARAPVNGSTVVWYVAVAPNPNTPYYIWANQPCAYNCIAPGKNGAAGTTSHGNCTVANGTCQCNKHYGGLWCYHTGLATVWIVLIVIGCAILLAIAIGVPVALYLRSRQRARYERV